MGFLSDFHAWAWARHHNVLSWYIRPMFILPFIYFACRRSWKRSWWWGLAVINLAAGGESGWAVLIPAVIGMLVCDAAVYLLVSIKIFVSNPQ